MVQGTVGSGAVQSGNIASGSIGWSHLSSGCVRGAIGTITPSARDVLSGTIGAADLGSGGVRGNVQVGAGTFQHIGNATIDSYNLASGCLADETSYVMANASGLSHVGPAITEEVVSGSYAVAISPSGNLRVAMASVPARMPAVGVVVDGGALSGIPCNVAWFGLQQATSGLVDYSGYLGTQLFVGRSGQIVTTSGSWNSGGLLSGDIVQPVGIAVNSGAYLVEMDSPFSFSGYIGSGVVGSGVVASGAVQGFFGATRNIASGTVGVTDFGSGAVIAGTVGSGAIQSGNIASGQIAGGHIASGGITSGWPIGSGSIWGRLGPQNQIASGSIGTFDIGSGQVVSGLIGSGQVGGFAISSGAVTSGRIAMGGTPTGTNFFRDDFTWQPTGGGGVSSGTISQIDFASGTGVEFLMPVISGLTTPFPIITEETISGVRAVALSQSGNLRVAMAGTSGRMPAIGVVVDNVASGLTCNVFADGLFQFTSGLADYSGWVGTSLFVGRSGQIVSLSGSFNSGGIQSGDITQIIGTAANSGAALIQVGEIFHSGFFLGSGVAGSGSIASGAVQGFFGPTRDIASGTVGVFDLGSGAVIAGTIGSGAVQSGNIASGQVGGSAFASGAITSGWTIGSGALFGRLGPEFLIASGTIGTFDIGSGQVVSGLIGSGQVGHFAIAANAITSGQVGSGGVMGRAAGGPFEIASGSIGQLDLSSGVITSGVYIGSGTILGQAGGGPFNIASGTVTTNDVGSGAIVSGLIASGQVGTYHLVSGGQIDWSQYLLANSSGPSRFPTALTQETISGVRAVNLTASGHLQVAMASVATRMPACGVVFDNVASGIPANVFLFGQFQFPSGLADYSGYVGTVVVVGRSGSVVSQSGSFNSGGLLSGDTYQPMGYALSSGAVILQLDAPPVSGGLVFSGTLGSGTVGGFFGTRQIASGTVGVFDFGSGAVIATTVGSGAVVSGNIASGQIGINHFASGAITSGWSHGSGSIWGRLGPQFLIASGTIGTFDLSSGIITSGVYIGSGTILGQQGGGPFNVASGTLGKFDLSSGILTSGVYIGSGTILGQAGGGPFQISSGTIGSLNLASGIITSGVYVGSGTIIGADGGGPRMVASGTLGTFDLGSGQMIDFAQNQLNFTSGLTHVPIKTGETISGVRAVSISQSGFLQVAMASVSGRMPAIGVVTDNVLSGIQVNVFTGGTFTPSSGLISLSGTYGELLYVGRSGTVSTASGWFNSGGLLSGDITQTIGWLMGSGQMVVSVAATLPFVASLITSGNIASGQIGTAHISSGAAITDSMNVMPLNSGGLWKALTSESISGIKAVCIDITSSGGVVRTAMAAVSGRMPAIGVVADNVLSGIAVNIITNGYIPVGSGILGSGFLQGRSLWVGYSGDIIAVSGGYGSGGGAALSGFMGQRMGYIHFSASGTTSGAFLINVTNPIQLTSGIPVVGVTPAFLPIMYN